MSESKKKRHTRLLAGALMAGALMACGVVIGTAHAPGHATVEARK